MVDVKWCEVVCCGLICCIKVVMKKTKIEKQIGHRKKVKLQAESRG